MRPVRWILGLLAALAAGAGAYAAGARASRLRALAEQEERVAASVGLHTTNGRRAKAKADKLADAAKEANKRARANVTKLATTDPTVESLVSKWRKGAG